MVKTIHPTQGKKMAHTGRGITSTVPPTSGGPSPAVPTLGISPPAPLSSEQQQQRQDAGGQ